ncbi:MAG: hypothetical protein ABSD74_20040 [Rhizomicrobium sp.]|jgi:hypothetical protein
MANAQTATEAFDIGRVINRAISVIGQNFLTFFVLAALLTVPILLFTFANMWLPLLGPRYSLSFGTPGSAVAVIAGGLAGLFIYFLFTNLLQAAITQGTIVSLNGGHASFGECLATGIRNALPLTAIGVLAALGILGGFLLLIVPGVIFSLMWRVIMPVRVAEQTGITATLARSADLTRGHRGAIFLLDIMVGVLAAVLGLVIRPLAGLSLLATVSTATPVTFIVLTAVVRIVTYMIGATMVASIYYELRVIKEGVGPEQLAAIFS